jgi:phospholipase C
MLKTCRSPILRFSAVTLLGLSTASQVFAKHHQNKAAERQARRAAALAANEALSNVDHIIVIYQENWTFDGLYGSFPGANGLANASTASTTQVDRLNGTALSSEMGSGYNNPAYVPSGSSASQAQTTNPPPPLTADSASGVADTRFPNGLNTLLPYSASSYVDPTMITGDIYHRYWQEQYQIAGAVSNSGTDSRNGSNSGFVTWSDNPGLVMSHYDATNLPEGLLAQQYTICDNFFHSAFGGSYLNHQWLIAAASSVYNNMPVSNNGNIAYLDSTGLFVLNASGTAAGKYVRDGNITPVAGDQLTVTLNGVSTPVTLTTANTQAYDGAAGTLFDKHYAVNTIRSVNLGGNGENGIPGNGISATLVTLLPSQNDSNPANTGGDTRPYIPNIGDLLSQNNVTWKWYSGGYNQMLAYSGSNPSPTTSPSYASVNASLQLQYHHQPFVYFDNYAPFDTTDIVPSTDVGGFAGVGTTGLSAGQSGVTRAQNSAAHVQDETNFFTDVQNNTLPAVTFIKPVGVNNEHPGYAALELGQQHVAALVQAVQSNPTLWAHTAIVITYDEHGGRWDHVTPFSRDIWGPGERVPCIVISPFARKGFVNSTQLDTSSILATIEQRFLDSQHLNSETAGATTLANVFTALDIERGGYTINRRANKVTQAVTVTNLGSTTITGPVQLVLDNLANTTLTNATGTTANNPPASPYITISTGDLAAGAAATTTLQFTLPTSGGVSYSARTVTGNNP